jgi:surface antigen
LQKWKPQKEYIHVAASDKVQHDAFILVRFSVHAGLRR